MKHTKTKETCKNNEKKIKTIKHTKTNKTCKNNEKKIE